MKPARQGAAILAVTAALASGITLAGSAWNDSTNTPPGNNVPRAIVPATSCNGPYVCTMIYHLDCTGYRGPKVKQARHVDFGRCWWSAR